MIIKACGLREKEHIDWAKELGYTYTGVVLYKKSIRYLDSEAAIELSNYAKSLGLITVAVSKTFADVEMVRDEFDFIQIYQQINDKKLIFAAKDEECIPEKGIYVYDASMGSGEFKDFPQSVKDSSERVILAGGLNCENVKELVKTIKPYGVDVSSGIEKDGVKDYDLMKRFMQNAK